MINKINQDEFQNDVVYCSYCKELVLLTDEQVMKHDGVYHIACYHQKFNTKEELNFDE